MHPSGSFPKVRLCLLTCSKLIGGGGRALRLEQTKGPSAALEQTRGASAVAGTDLGSCRLGNCTFGKLPLEKISLGKYFTSLKGEGGVGLCLSKLWGIKKVFLHFCY